MNTEIKNVVFDLGGVLINWNPRALYKKIFADPQEMENFLQTICTQEWNERQDMGRPFAIAVNALCVAHPKFEIQIRAFDERWEEMITGPIQGTVDILSELKDRGGPRLFALSNWSHEKFPFAERNFPFLKYFEGLVVSGRVKMKKPDPRIYVHLCDQFALVPGESVFIDDVADNIAASERLGFHGIRFESPEQLRTRLESLGLL